MQVQMLTILQYRIQKETMNWILESILSKRRGIAEATRQKIDKIRIFLNLKEWINKDTVIKPGISAIPTKTNILQVEITFEISCCLKIFFK
jgi:hypothetical protein